MIGEDRVEHDHAEDTLDHRAGRERADALGAAPHLQALEAADGRDDEAEHRRLDHAGIEVPTAPTVSRSAVEELHEREVEVDRAGDRAAEQAHHVGEEGQQRQGDDQAR